MGLWPESTHKVYCLPLKWVLVTESCPWVQTLADRLAFPSKLADHRKESGQGARCRGLYWEEEAAACLLTSHFLSAKQS